jgi:hypothetical protein
MSSVENGDYISEPIAIPEIKRRRVGVAAQLATALSGALGAYRGPFVPQSAPSVAPDVQPQPE